ncbi:hypothetical protein BGAL_0330g00030 [Botrytis galanthina]|uniref:BTB domain-containing protein n=1 Tax=Botrytis galanthina TaxID=278940 RepID=A0A4S8QQY7_9HELO|nr:hypothetical protein BGAL_0330g00030 [Botrytis galanthina]
MSLKRGRSSSPSKQQPDIQEQNDPFKGLNTPFSETSTLGIEMIQIVVGKTGDQKTFQIHKKILCDRIPYFAQLLKDSHKSIIKYPEADPNTFDVLVEWTHTDCLRGIYMLQKEEGPTIATYRSSWSTKSLYLLAENLILPDLMDRLMEVDRRLDCSYNTRYYPGIINYIYNRTPKSSKLRRFVAELTAHAIRNSDGKFPLSTADLLSAMENKEFALDYLEISRRPNIEDPRTGSGCRFHVHGKNEKCTAKDHCGEGKVTALSVEELKKRIASALKKPRLH